MNGIYIPVIGLICLTILLITFAFLNSRNQMEIQTTIRALLDSGATVSSDVIDKITAGKSREKQDLRRGIFVIAFGLAIIVAGFITGAVTEFATIAVFPLFIGGAFLITKNLNGK